MKNINKKIIICTFLIIILIVVFINIKKINNKNGNTNAIQDNVFIEESKSIEEVFNDENVIQKINNKSQYFNVKKCIERYYQCIQDVVEYQNGKDAYKLQIALERLKSLIPDFAIGDLGITKENIYQKIGLPRGILRIDNISMSRQTVNKTRYIDDSNIIAYIVKGIIINTENINQKKEFKTIVVLDEINCTFFIIPEQYIQNKNLDIEEGKRIKIYEEDIIEENSYNKFVYSKETEEDLAVEYFNLLRYYIDYDIDYMYNKMDEKYRDSRFGNIENYRKYINECREEFSSIKAEEYMANYLENESQYVIKDQYQNLYIFDVKNPVDYTVRLDTYTISSDKFNTTYDKSNISKKVQMNIDKFFQMINRHDYKTSYGVIADSFKQTYSIDNEDRLKKLVRDTFFEFNSVKYKSFQELGDNTYECKINITDLTGNNQETKDIIIIMQIQDDRKFIMSFSKE